MDGFIDTNRRVILKRSVREPDYMCKTAFLRRQRGQNTLVDSTNLGCDPILTLFGGIVF